MVQVEIYERDKIHFYLPVANIDQFLELAVDRDEKYGFILP